jgi:hypothetical protein
VNLITVRPAQALRVDFARWAVAQNPNVRTCSASDFAVPAHLFMHMPERLLIGSTVDGHRYVPVADPEPLTASEDAPDGFREALPGEPLPSVPDSAYGPDAVPLDALPTADEEGNRRSDQDVAEGPPYACDLCPRDFTTARGRDTHRRQAHPEA